MTDVENVVPGFSVRGYTALGPRPVDALDFQCGPGVDVLFGRNGAGKSTVLSGLAAAAGGPTFPPGGSYLVHIECDDDGDPELAVAFDYLLRDTGGGPVARPGIDVAPLPWELPEVDSVRRQLSRRLYRTLAGFHADPQWEVDDSDWLAALVWSLIEPGRLVLHCHGVSQYLVLVAAHHRESSGIVRSMLDAFQCELYAASDFDGESISDPRIAALWDAFLDYGGDPRADRLFDHPWAFVPLFNIGLTIRGRLLFSAASSIVPLVLEDSATDLDRATVESWRAQRERLQMNDDGSFRHHHGTVTPARNSFFDYAGPDSVVSENVTDFVAELTASANHFLSTLLIDAPVLNLRPRDADAWVDGGHPLIWLAADPSGAAVPIENLSQAQRRWARIAISLALRLRDDDGISSGSGLMVLDEPEAALHPTAQRFLASGLEILAGEFGLQTLVATHSPALLRQTSSRLHHVRRDRAGMVEVVPLPSALSTDLPSLGLDPADLIQLARVFVIVEGRHDELIVETALADQLVAAAARVLAMRGSSNLSSVIDARFIFDYTDASVVVLVDNVGEAGAAAVWERARSHFQQGQLDAARDVLLHELNRKNHEERFLQEFGIRALEFGRAGRVSVVGLDVIDVIDLLPVEIMSPAAAGCTWTQLRDAAGTAGQSSGAFKTWMKKRYGLQLDDDTIVDAVRALEEHPQDLKRLATAIETATRHAGLGFL